MNVCVCDSYMNLFSHIRESVDSLCRDGAGPPIVCVHWKFFLILFIYFFFYTSEIRSTVQRYGRQHVNSCKLIQDMSPVQ